VAIIFPLEAVPVGFVIFPVMSIVTLVQGSGGGVVLSFPQPAKMNTRLIIVKGRRISIEKFLKMKLRID
ncbi:MAG: hypothetical protein EB025_04115, partial [Chitinophagaceae bacterium]|nr:hypothetical protein [Chitinophagaceae bacterium]